MGSPRQKGSAQRKKNEQNESGGNTLHLVCAERYSSGRFTVRLEQDETLSVEGICGTDMIHSVS